MIRERMQLTAADLAALDAANTAELARIQPVSDFFGGAQEVGQEARADEPNDSIANFE